MREKLLGAVTLIVSVGIFLFSVIGREPDVTPVFPGESPSALMWPLDHAWRWSVHRLPRSRGGTNDVSLVARVTRKPHNGAPLAIPAGPLHIHAKEAEAEVSAGTLKGVSVSDQVEVAVQVVDLDRVGVSPVDGARFRLLMTVSSHGTTSYLSGDQTHIYALGFAGWKPNEKAIWEQGEMHLGAFFFKTETDHVTYDIVVTAGDVPRSR